MLIRDFRVIPLVWSQDHVQEITQNPTCYISPFCQYSQLLKEAERWENKKLKTIFPSLPHFQKALYSPVHELHIRHFLNFFPQNWIYSYFPIFYKFLVVGSCPAWPVRDTRKRGVPEILPFPRFRQGFTELREGLYVR